jgi:hypothetical protein
MMMKIWKRTLREMKKRKRKRWATDLTRDS